MWYWYIQSPDPGSSPMAPVDWLVGNTLSTELRGDWGSAPIELEGVRVEVIFLEDWDTSSLRSLISPTKKNKIDKSSEQAYQKTCMHKKENSKPPTKS